MQHNIQLLEYGKCLCPCHQGKHPCNCGWLKLFPNDAPPLKRRIRRENLDSKVIPFRARYSPPIAVKDHKTHALRVTHASSADST